MTIATPKTVHPRLLTVRDVCKLTSLSRTSVWLKTKSGEFPQPVQLGIDGGRMAFVASEIEAWIDERIASRDKRLKQDAASNIHPLDRAARNVVEAA